MFKHYLKYASGIKAQKRYLRTVASLDARTADDIGIPEGDVASLAGCQNLNNAIMASRFSGGRRLSDTWSRC